MSPRPHPLSNPEGKVHGYGCESPGTQKIRPEEAQEYQGDRDDDEARQDAPHHGRNDGLPAGAAGPAEQEKAHAAHDERDAYAGYGSLETPQPIQSVRDPDAERSRD